MKNMCENEMKLEFISKSSNEAFARITVAAFASQLDPTIEELADIKTAVSEAVTNCIIHAYEGKEGIIKIICRLSGNEIQIEISDNGKGIENVETAKQPLYTSKPDLERSRNGIYNNGKLYGRDEIRINSWTWHKSYHEKNNKKGVSPCMKTKQMKFCKLKKM